MLSRILYEDKDIIVAYKPAGLAVQTAKLGQQDMVSELKNRREKGGNSAAAGRGEPYLGLIHRLDQPVEGILAFARTRAAAASLTGQLRAQGDEGGFCKHYYAVLCGVPDCREGRLEDYLYKQALKNGKHTDYRAVIVNPDTASAESALGEAAKARRAVLEYRILEPNKEQGLALADIRIRTGRFHQIRAQMAHAGLPLLGDLKYGSPEARALAAACGVRNVALCAYSLGFVHPVSGEKDGFPDQAGEPRFFLFSPYRKVRRQTDMESIRCHRHFFTVMIFPKATILIREAGWGRRHGALQVRGKAWWSVWQRKSKKTDS